jgi:hypothetical protein
VEARHSLLRERASCRNAGTLITGRGWGRHRRSLPPDPAQAEDRPRGLAYCNGITIVPYMPEGRWARLPRSTILLDTVQYTCFLSRIGRGILLREKPSSWEVLVKKFCKKTPSALDKRIMGITLCNEYSGWRGNRISLRNQWRKGAGRRWSKCKADGCLPSP